MQFQDNSLVLFRDIVVNDGKINLLLNDSGGEFQCAVPLQCIINAVACCRTAGNTVSDSYRVIGFFR